MSACTLLMDVLHRFETESTLFRSRHQRCSVRKGVLRNFTKFIGKHTLVIKKGTLAKVFSCEFCEISKNTFFKEDLWMTAFVYYKNVSLEKLSIYFVLKISFIIMLADIFSFLSRGKRHLLRLGCHQSVKTPIVCQKHV